MPTWAISQIYNPVDVPCSSDKVFPRLTFQLLDINGVERDFHIESDEYIQINDAGTKCSSVISPLDVRQDGMSDLFIVGDLFMSKYKCFFDRDSDQVGIALAVHKN